MANPRARRLWLRLHRWLGLVLGLPVALLCLTGIALAYADDIDAALNPRLYPSPSAPAVPLDRVLAAAASACAGADTTWLWLPHGLGPARIACQPPGRPLQDIMVDVRDGGLLAVRDYARSPLGVIVGLHTTLLLGETGRLMASALAALLAVSVVSGAVLWWPRGPGAWRRALRVAPWQGPGLLHRLHRVGGAAAAAVLLLVAVTALRLQFPESAAALLRPEGGASSPYRIGAGLFALPASGAARLPADALVAAAAARFPNAVLTDVWLPAALDQPAMIAFRQPYEANKDAGSSVAWVDRTTGLVLRDHDPFAADPGLAALTWLENLHSGEALGLVGRLTVQAGAITALLLWGTGATAWWRRRRSARHSAGAVTRSSP